MNDKNKIPIIIKKCLEDDEYMENDLETFDRD